MPTPNFASRRVSGGCGSSSRCGGEFRLARKDPPRARSASAMMLPGPDQVWLTDNRGQSHTSELRVVAVDQTAVTSSQSAC
jgi:hypothetical protein